MSTAKLALLIPNYNRPRELLDLLFSIYNAIKYASAYDFIEVLVVDDFSTTDLDETISPFLKYPNFRFMLQNKKCGNAEVAFLSALQKVNTEYVWLIGNDDLIMIDSIKCIKQLLLNHHLGFILLNPYLYIKKTNKVFFPIYSNVNAIYYEKTKDLFLDFGFVTSTTTFSCLIMKTKLVYEAHKNYELSNYATVYSHTFTIMGALSDLPALFIAKPLVKVTLNERLEEQSKLQEQVSDGVMFHHHTIGLASLIKNCSTHFGLSIETLGNSFEDEIDKNCLKIFPTLLSHFLLYFFLEQLIHEQWILIRNKKTFNYFLQEEINIIKDVITQFKDPILSDSYDEAITIYKLQMFSPQYKYDYLLKLQAKNKEIGHKKYINLGEKLKMNISQKIHLPNYKMFPLRGSIKPFFF